MGPMVPTGWIELPYMLSLVATAFRSEAQSTNHPGRCQGIMQEALVADDPPVPEEYRGQPIAHRGYRVGAK